MNTAIPLPLDELAQFCRRWRIARLEVFGSVLGEEFGPDSDVDFLVTWADDARVSLFDVVDAEGELSRLLGRPVDLVSRQGLEQSENYIRRRAILGSARPVYAAS